ncbi:ribonuclease H-like domain-containing protein, partial [Tanacetum coccineum]
FYLCFFSMAIGDASGSSVDLINNLDAGRPSCTCDAKSGSTKYTQLIRLMQFFMGLIDVYQPIRSTILAKDPLPNVKYALYVVSREESHRGLYPGSSSTTDCYPAGFKRNPNLTRQSGNYNKRFNANSEVNQSIPGTSGSISSSFTNEQMVKLLSLINEKPTPAYVRFFCAKSKTDMYHVTLGWIIDSGANQHMTDSTKNMFNVVDVSSLMLTVGHPNGALAKIYAIGSLRLSSGIVLFDVLVVPEYSDLNLGKLVGTGSESDGLYLFDLDKIGLFHARSFGCLCYSTILNNNDKFRVRSEKDVKFDENVFPFKMKNSNEVLKESNEVTKNANGLSESKEHSLNFFDVQIPISPYDEEGDTSNVEGNSRVTSDDYATVEDEVASAATQIEENVTSENQNGKGYSNTMGTSPELRRSTKQKVMPARFNDFFVNSSVRYGLEKYVCYSNLSRSNLCFSTTLNKSIEPKTFQEASQNPKWIKAMNLEMEALFRNNTYVLADLPPRRKAIRCKWFWKIKYKSSSEIDRYKARLVAKGFGEREGIDYEETFSLVVKMVTVRCLIALSVQNNWPLFQLDVNSAFLYGDLKEEVYMELPPSFVQSNDNNEIDKFKLFLSTKFMIKYLVCLLACKPAATPLQQKVVLGYEESESDKFFPIMTEYQQIVGKLIYLSITRPDIFYVVHCLSQHMHAPFQSHFSAALRVLRYLKNAPGTGVQFYKGNSFSLHAFSDADWVKCPKTRKSMSGFCLYLFSNLVSWKSKKQATISRSSVKSEYRCLTSTTCEIIWVVKILKDLGVEGLLPAHLYCDSNSAISIAGNPVFHEKTKHFKIDLHLVREKVANGVVKVLKVASANNMADIFTKGVIPAHLANSLG